MPIFANFATAADKPVKIAITSRTDQYAEEVLKFQDIFQNEFLNALKDDSGVILLERKDVDKIISEQKQSAGNIEPIVLGKLLGVDLFICLSLQKSEGKKYIEVAVLDVESANVVYVQKKKIFNDDYSAASKKLSELVLKQLPEIKSLLIRDKDKTAASVLSVYNRSPSDRLDYVEGILTEKLEDIISFFEGFRILRRNYVDIARSETDLSYSGWVRPSDKAVAQYSDIAVSIEFKEVNNSGVEFSKTPIEISVTLEGKKIDRQVFKVAGSVDNLTGIFNKLRDELKKRVASLKKEDDSEAIARKKEAQRLWKTFQKMKKGNELYKMAIKDGIINEKGKQIIALLEKILFLDPGFHEARFQLAHIYFTKFGSPIYSKYPMEQRILYTNKAISEMEYIFSNPPECSVKRFNVYSSSLTDMYSRLIWALQKESKKNNTDEYSDLLFSLQKRLYLLTRKTVLKVPPEELFHSFISRQVLDYFFNPRVNDVDGAVDFVMFLDKIIGKKYYAKHSYKLYWGNAPFGMATAIFTDKKEYKIAEHFLDLSRKTQPEMFERYGETLSHFVYYCKGDRKKAAKIKKDIRDNYREYRKSSDFATALMTAPVQIQNIKISKDLFLNNDYIPKNGVLRLYKKTPDKELYLIGIPHPHSVVKYADSLADDESRYKNFIIKERDNKGKITNTITLYRKDGIHPKITDFVEVDNYIYLTTFRGLMRFDKNTKDIKWFTQKDGLPYNILSSIERDGNKLWFTSGHYNEFSLSSFDLETNSVKAFINDKELNGYIQDMEKYESGFFLAFSYSLFFVDTESGKWEEIKNCRPVSRPVRYNGEIWLGARNGVGKISDMGFKKVLPTSFQKEISLFDNTRRMLIPFETPIEGKITALTSDGELLWIGSEKSSADFTNGLISKKYFLTAYDVKNDTWHGPFIFPSKIIKMDVNRQGYLMSYGKSNKMIKVDDLLNLAKNNNLVMTTEQYKKMLKNKFKDAGYYAQSIYAIMTRQPKEEIIGLLNQAIKENPEDYKALLWKGIYLKNRTIPEKRDAIEVYDKILSSKCPELIRKVAEVEKERVEELLKKALERQKRKQAKK